MIVQSRLLFASRSRFGNRINKRFQSTTTSVPRIALIPADGIGKEVVPATQKLLQALKAYAPLSFVHLEAGWETFQKTGKALPDETVLELKNCAGGLFGAVSSPSQKVPGYSSPIIGMRKALDLYANLRPCISAPSNVEGSREGVDILIVRENTECLYVKQERLEANGEKAIAERVITKKASERIGQMAYQMALKRAEARGKGSSKQPMVTIVHKSNVLSVSDGLFRETVLGVSKKYPQVKTEEQLVDSMVYKLILDPKRYDVVVAPNLYGDILSDAAAALVGGLGVAPSANVGDKYIVCEPVHGSAPDIEGKGIANPIATIRAAAMLLAHLGKKESRYVVVADAIERACYQVMKSGPLTPDMGGKATTTEVTDAVAKNALELLKVR